MKNIIFSIVICIIFMAVQTVYALTVTPTDVATVLVDEILGSEIIVTSSSYTGATGSAGLFSGAGSAIGIDSGIMLTSGSASLAVGPNNESSAGANNLFAGSSELDSIISGTTYDAAILDIDFTTTTGNIFFNFVFASEEYNEWVGSFNDVFAFFLDGANIALLPNGDPVSINNVNLGANSAYYIDNESGIYDIEYDGFTTVLTAQALDLSAGSHRLSIQIADASDGELDSAVFVQGGTFGGVTPGPSPVPEPGTILLIGVGLVALAGLQRSRRQ